MTQAVEFCVVSSLQKVFADEQPRVSKFLGHESILKGESYCFQIAFRGASASGKHQCIRLLPRVEGELAAYVSVRSVGMVPAELTRYADHDYDFLRGAKPGLYPDLLEEIDATHPLVAVNTQWRSVWIEFSPTINMAAGDYKIDIEFWDENDCFVGKAGTICHLIDRVLEPQKLIFTQWFHGDCISEYYGVQSLSDEHFMWMEKFICTAARNGINMILTPLFTPPLDTKKGGERPTIQLVGVTKTKTGYAFDFSQLKRFIDICKKAGIIYFEMSHLFTQWGAAAAPKIMANVDGEYKQIFGWDTVATGAPYKAFLDAFLPQLITVLYEESVANNTMFHISDEPYAKVADSYRAAADMVKEHLNGFKIIDALSEYAFYEQGLVENPIPASNHIKPFLEHNVPDLWTYYCCVQGDRVSNRYLSMSSARNRAIAVQLFKFDIKGFLHWGYNFWYTQHSISLVDPFAVTDAGLGFPAGDSFSVYPGKCEPLESIRIRVFANALCDLRAMDMLSATTGKDAVLSIIEEGIDPIAFDHTPYNEDYILGTRIKINAAIEKCDY